MADVVVDASVVAKWYIPEQDHGAARTLRDDYLDGTHDLYAPAMMPFEAVNALRYSGHYEGERLVEAAETLPEYGIERVPFRDAGSVAAVADEQDVTVYDAAYVALARDRDGTMYTADERLIDSLDGTYDDVVRHVRTYAE